VRRAAVVGGVLVAVAAGLGGAAWVGASWGGRPGGPAPAADSARQPEAGTDPVPSAEDTSVPAPGSGGAVERAEEQSIPPADRSTAPADEAGWTAVVSELYSRRAKAFTTPDPEALTDAYVPGSALLDRDAAALRTLIDAGQTLHGYAPRVQRLLEVTPDGAGRVVLRLVDELPGYRVQAAGAAGAPSVGEVPGREAAHVRLVLEQTVGGWRISDARVEP